MALWGVRTERSTPPPGVSWQDVAKAGAVILVAAGLLAIVLPGPVPAAIAMIVGLVARLSATALLLVQKSDR
jgi:hypothetical protein